MDTAIQFTGYAFLFGLALVVVGAIMHAIGFGVTTAEEEAPADEKGVLEKIVDALIEAFKDMRKIIFAPPGSKRYTAGQRMMATGFALMILSGLVWIGLFVADAAGAGDDGGDEDTDTATTTAALKLLTLA